MSNFFHQNKILLITFTIIMIIGGLFACFNIPRNEDPGFKIRTAAITTVFAGANAEQVDKYVTKKLVEALEQMGEVEHIKTRSKDELSVVYVDLYEKYKDLGPIWTKMRYKVDNAQKFLPKGAKVQVDDEFGDVFGIIVALKGNDYEYFELQDFAMGIRDELLKLSQVAKVQILGVQDQILYLIYEQDTLRRYNLGTSDLAKILEDTNIISPSGLISLKDNRIVVQAAQNYTDPETVENAQVTIPGSTKAVRLGEIFRVEKGYQDPSEYVFKANGEKALALAISLKDGGNILELGDEVKKTLTRLQKEYPLGIDFEIVAFQSDYVDYLTKKFSDNLIQSIVIVVGIILLILGLKTGLIVGAIIPVTVLSSMFLMFKFGIGLDKISLSALIISLGILVDNSIVVAENSIRGMKCGKETCEATIASARKFQRPLLVATLVTSCAFLPVYLAKSQVGEYASSLFKVVAMTLLFSWFYSLTLLPYLINAFFKNKNLDLKKFRFGKYFAPFARWTLNRPVFTLSVASILLLFSFVLFSFVPKIYFPDSDRPMFEVVLKTPDGSNIALTQKATSKVERYIKAKDEVTNFSSYIGGSPPRYVLSCAPGPNKPTNATILVNVKKAKYVPSLIEDIQAYCDKNLIGVKATVRKVPLGPPSEYPVEIRVYGKDSEKLFQMVRQVQEKLLTLAGITLVENNWGSKVSRINLDIDTGYALKFGLTNQDIASSLQGALLGGEVTSYYRNTVNVPVMYRLDRGYANNVENLSTLNVYSPKLQTYMPLSEVARLELSYAYPEVFRRDDALTVTVQAQINKNITTAHKIIEQMRPYLDSIDYPVSYGYEIGGTVEDSQKGNKSITDELPTAFAIILLILIVHFNSIKMPIVVFLTAVLALVGANIGLFITGSSFGFMTFLGYICLVGIATSNSIVLIDSIETNDKLGVQNAVRSRIVPICLTAFTTIGAILPLWLSNDSMFSSLAVVIIFGLLSSVAITLFVTPALYILLMQDSKEKSQA